MRYDLDALEDDAWGRGYPPDLTHRGGGIVSHYDPRIGREILQMMLRGMTIREIAAFEEMPAYATIYQWVKMHPDFAWRWEGVRAHLALERVGRRLRGLEAERFWQRQRAKMAGKRWWRRGRPSSYTGRRGMAVCRRIAGGDTLAEACARPGMPSAKVVYTWLKREPGFRDLYVAARAYQQSWLELLELDALTVCLDDPTPAALKAGLRRAAEIRAHMGRMRAKTWKPEALGDD